MMLQVVLNGLVAGGPIALFALGFSIVFSVERLFHVGHAAVFTSAAYVAFVLQEWWGFPCGIAIVLAIVAATAIGMAMELAVYAPMRKFGATPLTMLVASLGLVVLGQSCTALAFGSQTLSLRLGEGLLGHKLLSARLTTINIVSLFLSTFAFSGVLALLKWTKIGLRLRALASDSELARIVGIPRERVILGAFGMASATAALASLLVAYDTDLTPMMGLNMLLLGLTAAVIGGLGNASGAVLGGLLIGLTQNIAAWFLPIAWQDAVVFLILIVFLLGRPHGLLGIPTRKAVV